jgi:AcrR family transcriptional regulator
MFQNQQSVSARGRGRPQVRSDAETLRLIVEAAAQVFRVHGYAAANVADVAQSAGVSTKTLYRLVPTKAALFESVVADRIDRFVLEVDHEVCATCDAVVVLEELLTTYGRFALEERTVSINKLVLAEGGRFPEMIAYFYEKAVLRTKAAMVNVLSQLRDRGLIAIDDLEAAIDMLRGMMVMEPQRAVMLGMRDAPSDAEIVARAANCARLFLEGCGARSSAKPN